MSSARSIAAAICPSASFLVPRRARIALQKLQLRAGSSASKHDAAHFPIRRPQTKSSFLRKVQANKAETVAPPVLDETSAELPDLFRSQVFSGNLLKVAQLYPRMVASALFTHNDSMNIAKLLHNEYRRRPQAAKSEALPTLLAFAEQLTEDIRTGAIPPHRVASMHLISFFKEAQQYDKGYELWSWLSGQGNDFVDASVYGAAIEMLAYQGYVQLPELEAMYAEALQRFPGNFAEYHLSPEAILPDRGQPVTIKGLPASLLQGITTARLLLGDWRNAYMAFDTALRLFPTQVPERFFALFIGARPPAESYTIFMVACRSGIIVRPDRLTVVINKLAESQAGLPLEERLLALKGMLNAIHAYVGAGGSIGGTHLTTVVKGFEGLLPESSAEENDASDSINQLIGDTARQTVQDFSLTGVAPSLSTFASLIGLAGKARLPRHLGSAIQDITATGLEPNAIVRRSMVLAAGQIGHLELLEWSWKSLVEAAEAAGKQLLQRDWQALARACKDAGHAAFVEQQTSLLRHTITDRVTQMIQRELAWNQTRGAVGVKSTKETKALIESSMAEVTAKVEEILSLIKSGTLHNFYEHPFPMSLIPGPSLGSEDALRAVYDELTTDPRQPPTSDKAAMRTPSGYALDELRFANWISMNELLADAEAHEERQRQVDDALEGDTEAVAAAADLTQLVLSPRRRSPRDGDADLGTVDEASALEATRLEVRRLRGLKATPQFALDP